MDRFPATTGHALKRARQRLGLKRKAIFRDMDRVRREALPYSETRGSLRGYLDHLQALQGRAEDFLITQQGIYIIVEEQIVTVIKPPQALRRAVAAQVKAWRAKT